MLQLGALMPHPPVMVPGIGRPADLAQLQETIEAVKKIDRILAEDPPETLVVFTPHGTVYSDAIVVYADQDMSGGLQQFGLDQTWHWRNDQELAEQITAVGQAAGLPVYLMDQQTANRHRRQEGLDHGVLVPLSFFDPAWAAKVKLVVIPLSYLPIEELYQFGAAVRKASDGIGRKVAVIASGDLSHCLKPGAPAPYDPRGEEFDHKIMELLTAEAVTDFFELDPILLEKAAECGFRSLIMLLGVMDREEFRVTVHSYQGPFGVGYGVASFHPAGTPRESLVQNLFKKRDQAVQTRRDQESPLVRYARGVVAAHALGETIKPQAGLDDFLKMKAGVFVSIKKHGQLRGCIGTTEPTQANVVEEVKQNAISASTRDYRFEPVATDELQELVYSVDILKPAEPVAGVEQLDPERYGVIVTKGSRRGLLLPNIEGVESAAEQVAIAKRKAGIGEGEAVELERFEVVRYY